MADWGRNLLGGLRPEQARGPLLGGHDLEGSGEVLNRTRILSISTKPRFAPWNTSIQFLC